MDIYDVLNINGIVLDKIPQMDKSINSINNLLYSTFCSFNSITSTSTNLLMTHSIEYSPAGYKNTYSYYTNTFTYTYDKLIPNLIYNSNTITSSSLIHDYSSSCDGATNGTTAYCTTMSASMSITTHTLINGYSLLTNINHLNGLTNTFHSYRSPYLSTLTTNRNIVGWIDFDYMKGMPQEMTLQGTYTAGYISSTNNIWGYLDNKYGTLSICSFESSYTMLNHITCDFFACCSFLSFANCTYFNSKGFSDCSFYPIYNLSFKCTKFDKNHLYCYQLSGYDESAQRVLTMMYGHMSSNVFYFSSSEGHTSRPAYLHLSLSNYNYTSRFYSYNLYSFNNNFISDNIPPSINVGRYITIAYNNLYSNSVCGYGNVHKIDSLVIRLHLSRNELATNDINYLYFMSNYFRNINKIIFSIHGPDTSINLINKWYYYNNTFEYVNTISFYFYNWGTNIYGSSANGFREELKYFISAHNSFVGEYVIVVQ